MRPLSDGRNRSRTVEASKALDYVDRANAANLFASAFILQKEAAMAMSMTGEVDLPAPRGVVWEKLNDPDVLKACIPGCQELVKEGDTAFRATAKLAIGPVKATFKGKVTLSDVDPPNGYTITGEGEGGIAGFAKGGAKVRLSDAEGGGTKLAYDVQANVGGKIAQLGSRLIDGVAKKMSDNFFSSFAKSVSGKANAS